MKMMNKALLCIAIIICIFPAGSRAQTQFEKQLFEILSASKAGIRSAKGPKSTDVSTAGVYDCKLRLDHFDTYVDDARADLPVFLALSNTQAAEVDCNMLVMLPPRGYTVKDTQKDKTIKLRDGIKRNVMLVNGSEGLVISMDYLTDNSITITIIAR